MVQKSGVTPSCFANRLELGANHRDMRLIHGTYQYNNFDLASCLVPGFTDTNCATCPKGEVDRNGRTTLEYYYIQSPRTHPSSILSRLAHRHRTSAVGAHISKPATYYDYPGRAKLGVLIKGCSSITLSQFLLNTILI